MRRISDLPHASWRGSGSCMPLSLRARANRAGPGSGRGFQRFPGARRQRSRYRLRRRTPFLAGVFLADETDPGLLFGTVKDFAASRKCPVAWLIEEGEKAHR